ncbi:MAG: hypothetical protein QXO71_04905, partial [Candidatus Jordarchaeaceae archaeon]
MYEKIYSVWEKEQKEETLQKLEESFYIAAKKFLDTLKAGRKELEPLINKLVEKEYNNISFMLKDLMNIRLDKIFRNIRVGKE